MPCIGIEYTKWQPGEHDRVGLRESFRLREDHWMKLIDKYLELGRVLVVCGDTHLRTIATPELGRVSPMQVKYGKRRDCLIIRTVTVR